MGDHIHHQEAIAISTRGRRLIDVTEAVEEVVHTARVKIGLAVLFVQHTSASILIQENADPAVQRDLEAFLSRLVPDGDPIYAHTAEGPDDMPAHVRSVLTATSLTIPISAGRLALGTWQGIYVWEHRLGGHRRRLVVHVNGQS